MARAHLSEAELAQEWLSPGQVAHLLGVDSKTVTRWAKTGLIGFITTPGGHRRYARAEIDALAHRTERTTTDG